MISMSRGIGGVVPMVLAKTFPHYTKPTKPTRKNTFSGEMVIDGPDSGLTALSG